MKLTYRGVQYSEKDLYPLTLMSKTSNREIIYRGNSPQARLNPKFPYLAYIKQLLPNSESKSIIDPIAFWYRHRREFAEDCWRLDSNLEKLDLAWKLTIRIEKAKALKSSQKIQLKYRGVTYYK